ncbi:MAG: hypothetical protein MUF61_01165 [archaeon]|jgi:hypothetical protein|nr:hypothetical protein [archaeon]
MKKASSRRLSPVFGTKSISEYVLEMMGLMRFYRFEADGKMLIERQGLRSLEKAGVLEIKTGSGSLNPYELVVTINLQTKVAQFNGRQYTLFHKGFTGDLKPVVEFLRDNGYRTNVMGMN